MEPNTTSSDELTAEQNESQTTLMAITGLTDDIKAKQYLEMCTWNLEQAVNLALEGGNSSPLFPPGNNDPPYIPPDIDDYNQQVNPNQEPVYTGYMDDGPIMSITFKKFSYKNQDN